MQLPDFLQFQPFNLLRKRMGARSLGQFEFFDPRQHLTADERKQLLLGQEVPIGKIKVLEDQTLAYKNSRVILFVIENSTESTGEELPEFDRSVYHIAGCDVIEKWQSGNRQVLMSTSTENIAPVTSQPYEICTSCLQTLRFHGFDGVRDRHRRYSQRVREEFSLEDFFYEFPCYPIKINQSSKLV